MPKLNQILAIEKGVKNRTNVAITEAHHATMRTEALTGLSRNYTPIQDGDEVFPSEFKRVTTTVKDEIAKVRAAMVELIDITATKDAANTQAKADVVVDGQTLLVGIPAVTLLWLEKQVTDLKTIVQKLPVLDAAEKWTYDSNAGAYTTEPVTTVKSKKVPKVLIKYEATDKHPAQTEVYTEDVSVGHWTTTKFSGAIPADEKAALLVKVEALLQATQAAREEANLVEATKVEIGDVLLGYVFG